MKSVRSYRHAAIAAALLTAILSGCGDERVAQVSREAANRQAEQNRKMAEVVGESPSAGGDPAAP